MPNFVLTDKGRDYLDLLNRQEMVDLQDVGSLQLLKSLEEDLDLDLDSRNLKYVTITLLYNRDRGYIKKPDRDLIDYV